MPAVADVSRLRYVDEAGLMAVETVIRDSVCCWLGNAKRRRGGEEGSIGATVNGTGDDGGVRGTAGNENCSVGYWPVLGGDSVAV